MSDSQKELAKAKKLVDQIALIIAKQHHYFSEGEVRSIHKAMDQSKQGFGTCGGRIEASKEKARKIAPNAEG